MARARSMTRNQNHDDEEASSSRKRPKTCASWSDLNHDLLFLVMLRLGVVDFLFLSGVCKSWRSLALSNRHTFMASTPPMSVTIFTTDADEKECYLEDFEGRKFKTILPHFPGDNCIGLTCGCLVFFMWGTRDFRLVNPITRHQLHFPDFPADDYYRPNRSILAFSASISEWVFVVLSQNHFVIWFCIAGERAWNDVSYHRHIRDLYAFRGKICAETSSFHLSELRLDGSQPKLTPLEIRQPDCFYINEFVSSGESLYVIGCYQDYRNSFHELDFGEMKWVKVEACYKRIEEYAFFSSYVRPDVAVKRESWADPRSWSPGRYSYTHNTWKIRVNSAKMWYFPHECLTVDRIDE